VASQQTAFIPADVERNAEAAVTARDTTSSLEDMFGLGNDQLRELMEQELPVPREDLVTGKEVKEEQRDKSKVFKLPDLKEYMDSGAGGKDRDEERKRAKAEQPKVDRSNPEEYLRVLQLNPFADADDAMFMEEVSVYVLHACCYLIVLGMQTITRLIVITATFITFQCRFPFISVCLPFVLYLVNTHHPHKSMNGIASHLTL
jgi:hypothetical protein